LREHEPAFLLHHYLIDSAHRLGSAVAIMEDEQCTTFEQLAGKALSLAATLRERGLGKGDRVALIMPKSTEAIISLFATLLAGGIYVPLEPRWPPDRIEAGLADCMPGFVIAQSAKDTTGRIRSLAGMNITTDSSPLIFDLRLSSSIPWSVALGRPATRFPEPAIQPDDPALILFTSGSTGRPKGVTLSHRAVGAFVRWTAEEFKLSEKDRLACPSPLSFDLSTFDIFNMALRGATCVIVPHQIVWMPRFLAQFISGQRITAWYCVPSVLSGMLAERSFAQGRYPDLRSVIFAGEVFPGYNLAKIRATFANADFYNLYGPTETNVVTWYRVPNEFDPGRPIPIGRPCPYAELMFDPADVERGNGVETGDLLVAGESLMSGYWNKSAETCQVFVDMADRTQTSKRFYRTGDRISLDLAAGDYTFVGRKDRQVKRRGYRIELGEIETALRQHPGVLEAAVISDHDVEMKHSIVAFVRGDPHAPISEVELRTQCAQYLPAYMMPDHIVFLPVLPQSGRGKTDYRALAELLWRS
jgi:amino acid adenylation domain-containing protein